MRPEHFHYLLEIQKRHSISGAARVLHLGQTTLSSIVKSVEEELGFPIFHRTPNGVAPTVEGERLMALAWEIDVKYEELLSLKERGGSAGQPIPVLLAPSINVGLSVQLSERYAAYELHGDLMFMEAPRLEIGPRILQNTANLGVTCFTGQDSDQFRADAERGKISIEQLYRDRFYLLVRPDHFLAGREWVTPANLCDQSLAVDTNFNLSKSTRLFGEILRGCSRVTSFPSITLAMQAVEDLNMASILTGFAICGGGSGGLRAVPLRAPGGADRISVCLLRRGGRNLRYQERILVSCIRSCFEALRLPLPAAGRGEKREEGTHEA